MAEPTTVGDLQIHQDLLHQQREWRIERIGWVVAVLILLAALAGLLGPGPVSSGTAGEKGSALWVEYDRLARYEAPGQLRIHLGPDAARDGKVRLALSRSYIENLEVLHIDPRPERVEATSDRFIYTFNVPEAPQGTAVTYHFEANTFGRNGSILAVEGGPQLHFTQFVYP
jgi:hypothetical protein